MYANEKEQVAVNVWESQNRTETLHFLTLDQMGKKKTCKIKED
jgi:hypothetical protein